MKGHSSSYSLEYLRLNFFHANLLSESLTIIIDNRTASRLILSVIKLVINNSEFRDFVNHSFDYRPNWTPRSLITVINVKHWYTLVPFHFVCGEIVFIPFGGNSGFPIQT